MSASIDVIVIDVHVLLNMNCGVSLTFQLAPGQNANFTFVDLDSVCLVLIRKYQ